MASGWVVPFLAGIIAALFAARVWGQWTIRRRSHQLAWAVGLTTYAAATLVDAYIAVEGWAVWSYRLFFALAGANVGLLGLGTVLLARPGVWGRVFALFIVACALLAALGQFAVPLSPTKLVGSCVEGAGAPCAPLETWGSELGAKAIPWSSPARWAFLLLNVVGGVALIGGALLSWWKTRAAGVLLIAAGAMLPALGGSLSTIASVDLRVLAQFLGIAVMFAGYLKGREPIPPTTPAAPAEG